MPDFDTLKPDFGAATDEPSLGYDIAKEPSAGGEEAGALGGGGPSLDTIMRIPVSVKIVLGTASMSVAALLKLGRGALIPLDRKIGEPVDVVVNDRVVARGEVVVMDDDPSRFGISLTEVVGPSGPDKLP